MFVAENDDFERIVKLPKCQRGAGRPFRGKADMANVALLTGAFEGGKGSRDLRLLQGAADTEAIEFDPLVADGAERLKESRLSEVGSELFVGGAFQIEPAGGQEKAVVVSQASSPEAGLGGDVEDGVGLDGGVEEGRNLGAVAGDAEL